MSQLAWQTTGNLGKAYVLSLVLRSPLHHTKHDSTRACRSTSLALLASAAATRPEGGSQSVFLEIRPMVGVSAMAANGIHVAELGQSNCPLPQLGRPTLLVAPSLKKERVQHDASINGVQLNSWPDAVRSSYAVYSIIVMVCARRGWGCAGIEP